MMHALELKVPPPIVALFIGTLMWLTARSVPLLAYSLPARHWIAGCVFVVGLAVSTLGVVSFRRAGTTVNPMQPHKASALVTSGIFRYSRNPMYLGLLIALFGWALFLANAVAVLFLPALVLYLNRFQIVPEENALAAAFDTAFSTYRARVRRWL
jgi:protein-S-isoprenylcysteine O-methyltransferase Ste14